MIAGWSIEIFMHPKLLSNDDASCQYLPTWESRRQSGSRRVDYKFHRVREGRNSLTRVLRHEERLKVAIKGKNFGRKTCMIPFLRPKSCPKSNPRRYSKDLMTITHLQPVFASQIFRMTYAEIFISSLSRLADFSKPNARSPNARWLIQPNDRWTSSIDSRWVFSWSGWVFGHIQESWDCISRC
jgi:hypothetical protein